MKKFYFLFTVLLALLGGATSTMAQEQAVVEISMKTGAWSLSSSPAYARQWMSDVPAEPKVSVTAAGGGGFSSTTVRGTVVSGSANNMYNPDGNEIHFFTGFSSNLTYTYQVDVQIGWHIVAASIKFAANNDETGVSVSLAGSETVNSENTEDVQSISVDGLEDVTVNLVVGSLGTSNVNVVAKEFTITVEKDPESVTALAELQAALSEYGEEKFMTGTEPGNYNAEAVAAFKAAINAAYDIEGNPDLGTLPDAELAALYRQYAQNIVDAYEAVVASRNLVYNLTDGYYRIKSGLQYYVTETTTDEDTGNTNTVTSYVDKYLHSVLNGETINAQWKTPDDLENDCVSLWKVTATEDGNYDVVSMATDARFDNVTMSANVTMSLTSENLIHVYPVATVDGITYTNLRVSTQTGDYQYMHQGGHSSGAGVSGNLVGWAPTAAWATDGDYINFGATEWVFVPVTEAEAERIIEAYQPVKDETMLKERYKILLADAKANLEIAKDETKVDLITSTEQFASPYTETREGSLDNLLDGDGTTYWHSDWSTDPGLGVHYLQVEMPENVTEDIYITFTRRNGAANDHVTEWGVYGSNTDYGTTIADKSTLDSLALLSTPFTSNTETLQSAPFNSKNYKYLLFYAEGTNANRGYWHVSEFQLSYDVPNEHSQAVALGELATNLENVLKAQEDTELDDIKAADYEALKAAYDAFMEKFVDPTPLRELLAELDGTADIVVVGDQPGFWPSNEGADAFNSNYAAAVAYDAAGAYTAAKSEEYIATLTAQSESIYDAAKKVETGKWYRIRFGTEEEFEKYGWSMTGASATDDYESLFGKYLTSSWLDGDNNVEAFADAEWLGLGDNIFFDADEDISDKDLTLFRFIAVGDSAYVLQNKGTNLFLRATSGASYVTLNAHPSLFSVRAIGYGENALAVKDLVTGDSYNYLHGQRVYNALITWNANTPGSNSGLYIEEAGDVEADYVGDEFKVWALDGELAPYCFPVDITGVDTDNGQMYGVAVEDETVKLFPIEKANAGRPFIYIKDMTTENYNPDATEDDYDLVVFKHGYTFVNVPDNGEGALKGVFASTVIDRGDIYIDGNQFVVNKNSKDIQMSQITIPANSAYLTNEGDIPVGTVLELVIDEEMEDGIAGALANVAKGGAVYTIDGRLVSKKANVNDLQKFGKGVYILNGTKVVVK